MPFPELRGIGHNGTFKLVDAIPPECGVRKRRRPTVTTEETHHSSDDELSEIVVVAVGEDSENDSVVVKDYETPHSTPCQTPPLSLNGDVLDFSVEEVLRCKKSRQLIALLEVNQRNLQDILGAREGDLFCSPKQEEQQEIFESPLTTSSVSSARVKQETWRDAKDFEIQKSLPGAVGMILYATAHAATYELMSNVVYEAVDRAATEFPRWILYTVMLVIGCLLARVSGLVWNFTGPLAYKRVKWIYHNRIRLGAVDARWLDWLQEQGEIVVGLVHILSYYLCYIAMVFFVGQLAVYCDQREDILEDLPSALYQEELEEMMEEEPIDSSLSYQSPAQDYSAHGLFGYQTQTNWDPVACSSLKELDIFGAEDEKFLFQSVSKNSYDHFLGQEFEIPMFDAPHQILFYATLAVTAFVIMKRGFGFSFESGW